jgi:hypothetical protein
MEAENTIMLLKSKREEIEMKANNWFEIAEQVYDFASNASQSFDSADIKKKKLIFRSLGSNWILKDEKLSVEIKPWFLPIQKYMKIQ